MPILHKKDREITILDVQDEDGNAGAAFSPNHLIQSLLLRMTALEVTEVQNLIATCVQADYEELQTDEIKCFLRSVAAAGQASEFLHMMQLVGVEVTRFVTLANMLGVDALDPEMRMEDFAVASHAAAVYQTTRNDPQPNVMSANNVPLRVVPGELSCYRAMSGTITEINDVFATVAVVAMADGADVTAQAPVCVLVRTPLPLPEEVRLEDAIGEACDAIQSATSASGGYVTTWTELESQAGHFVIQGAFGQRGVRVYWLHATPKKTEDDVEWEFEWVGGEPPRFVKVD